MDRGLTADDYRALLFAMLPPGVVWPTDSESRLQQLLLGMAQEFVRVDIRARELMAEADPRQALELFPEWESSYSLPGNCAPAEQSLVERRLALIGRIVGRGGMRAVDYTDMADGLGYPGTQIIEHHEATVEVVNGVGPRGAEIGDLMNGEDWLWAWDVLVPSGVIREAIVGGSECGDPLRSWGDELIECALHEAAPSWLVLNVGYREV
ncbi:YmfQ family protein [Bordetella petrii]|uniref:Tail protein, putative n=1 Tax=Bordetella petrii (strain ATCC BAA-461 / DSM 12804 / CCUG 43448 / CIP 107267 / Se-1111R) TaxID=340100 RepID=A9ID86_BORPD|nr:putative phage tail protein [Bordetella petrii]CAP44779.1 tail protein, putative [Bordetella petrii]